MPVDVIVNVCYRYASVCKLVKYADLIYNYIFENMFQYNVVRYTTYIAA